MAIRIDIDGVVLVNSEAIVWYLKIIKILITSFHENEIQKYEVLKQKEWQRDVYLAVESEWDLSSHEIKYDLHGRRQVKRSWKSDDLTGVERCFRKSRHSYFAVRHLP